MNPDIGVKVITFNDAGSQFGTTQEFTVSAGDTHRLFIVPPGTANINPTDLPSATFILGTVGLGNIRFDPVATDPSIQFLEEAFRTSPCCLSGERWSTKPRPPGLR